MAGQGPKIVVGVDGSKASVEALRWAVDQAEQTGGHVKAIVAWRQPVTYGMPADFSDVDFENEARHRTEMVISDVLGSRESVPVELCVTEGHAAPILVDASRDADLLVVGSHGRGTFSGMLLGSTSLHVAHHATCPVVIVRAPA